MEILKYPQMPVIEPVVCEKFTFSGQCYVNKVDYMFDFKGKYYTINSGFLYDGASIPRIAWSLLGVTPDGVHRAATLIHDYLYANKKIFDHTRKEVDLLFYKHLRESGLGIKKSTRIYLLLKYFGWIAGRWKK
jgi:hypothetical protein